MAAIRKTKPNIHFKLISITVWLPLQNAWPIKTQKSIYIQLNFVFALSKATGITLYEYETDFD